MSTLLTVLHVIVCLFLMLTVLLQDGKSGGMGGAFGGSNAGTVFGGSGSSSFLRKLTATAATIFMATSMLLAFLASHNAADALERFGESQQKMAKEKEQARKDALKNGAGSGSAGSNVPPMIDLGSNAPSMGSGSAATGSAATGSAATGSAATGSAATGSAATGSAATGSAATGSGSLTVPAEKPPEGNGAKQPTMGTPSPKDTVPGAGSTKAPTTAPAVTPPAPVEKKPATGTAAPVNPQPTKTPTNPTPSGGGQN